METIVESGYFGQSKNNIVYIKNFVDPITILEIYNFCKNIKDFKKTDDVTWSNRVMEPDDFQKVSPELFKKIKHIYLNRLKKQIEEKFNVVVKKADPSIVIWRPGDNQPPHADKEEPDGSPNRSPFYDLSSLIYINDDYDGGEIFFPQHDIEINPSAGDAVFFPGDKFYLHGVNEIKNNNRFTIPVFWTVIEKL